MTVQFGVTSFGEQAASAPEPELTLRELVEEAVLADRLGLSFFGLGEHHREDFAVSAPEVLLGAIAARTTRIHLGPAAVVLPADEPYRVAERYATLNALAPERAELIVGKGAYLEPLVRQGIDPATASELFGEKVRALASHLEDGTVTPHPGRLPLWVASGGSRDSALLAAELGAGLIIALRGGSPLRYRSVIEEYRAACRGIARVGIQLSGLVGDTDEEAAESFWPVYRSIMASIGKERGWGDDGVERYRAEIGPDGSLLVAGPETARQRLRALSEELGLDRVLFKYGAAGMTTQQRTRSIRRFAEAVTEPEAES